MDLGTLLRVLLRRWPVVLVMVVITGLTAWGVERSVELDYQASSAVLLLSPTTDDINPYSGTTKGLETTATAMAIVMNGPTVKSLVSQQVKGVSISVTAGTSTSILGLRVIGPVPDGVMVAQNLLLEILHDQLRDRQIEAGVPETQLVRDAVLTVSPRASARHGSRDRSLAAVALLGLLATVTAAIIADRLAVRRMTRHLSFPRSPGLGGTRRDVSRAPAPNAFDGADLLPDPAGIPEEMPVPPVLERPRS